MITILSFFAKFVLNGSRDVLEFLFKTPQGLLWVFKLIYTNAEQNMAYFV